MNGHDIRSILAASDLTDASDAVVSAAARLAARTGAELHLVHAFEPLFPTFPETAAVPPPAPGEGRPFRSRLREAEEALGEQLLRVAPDGHPPASATVLVGTSHGAILDRARAIGAGLIVLGPHREHLVADRFLGSTAERVIRTAESPCLVVRGELSMPLRRITVPIDLADPALPALDFALGWAAAHGVRARDGELTGVEVRVVHLAKPVAGAAGFLLERAWVGPELSRAVEEALERSAAGANVEVREEIVWGGKPAQEIPRLAERDGADLLVLGTHGRGAVGRVVVGSVASEVARSATCPVLLIPPKLWVEQSPRRKRGATFSSWIFR